MSRQRRFSLKWRTGRIDESPVMRAASRRPEIYAPCVHPQLDGFVASPAKNNQSPIGSDNVRASSGEAPTFMNVYAPRENSSLDQFDFSTRVGVGILCPKQLSSTRIAQSSASCWVQDSSHLPKVPPT